MRRASTRVDRVYAGNFSSESLREQRKDLMARKAKEQAPRAKKQPGKGRGS